MKAQEAATKIGLMSGVATFAIAQAGELPHPWWLALSAACVSGAFICFIFGIDP
jgi:hypothetical protein